MNNKKFIITIIILAVIVAAVSFFAVNEARKNKEMSQLFAVEKQEMENEYSTFATQYDELQIQINNDSLREKLESEKLKTQRLLEELRQVKTSDAAEIMRLKKELKTVRAVLRSYVMQIDSLNKINAALMQENQEVKSKYSAATAQISNLSQETKSLNEKVSLAAQLDATNIRVQTLNKRGRDTERVKNIKKIAISFTIVKNITAQTGNKTLYVRIAKPDNEVLTKSPSNQFKSEDRNISYSIKKYIEYTGEEQTVTVYWDVEEFLAAGTYHVYILMQENYLFYEDIPAEEKLDFFKKPAEFLTSAASSKDQKNGYVFSHVDSVLTTSRATSTYPSFGFEAALVRTEGGTNALRVLYTQPNSPAEEAGLKRGDWIIAVDNQKVSTSDYSTYITRPTKAYSFTLGKYNPYPEEVDDPEFNYVEFDTLGVVQMPEPRYVEEQDVLKYSIISSGSRKAFYLLYNEFGESADALKEAFSQLNGQQFDDIILDLRYNPGGYVNTSQQLCSALVPATAMGQPFLHMTYNDKINKTETLNFESSPLTGGASLSYQNLYVLTSGNTASASEIVINCLKPYMEGRLYQVGAATFGKNVAQQLFTNAEAPGVELWLTTTYLSNSQGYYDYFKNGLLPDFEIEENYGAELGDFGSAEDQLMQPVLYRMENGSFPVVTNPDESEDATTLSRSRTSKHVQLLVDPIARKPHYNRIKR